MLLSNRFADILSNDESKALLGLLSVAPSYGDLLLCLISNEALFGDYLHKLGLKVHYSASRDLLLVSNYAYYVFNFSFFS